jgi:hypothetical protein
MEETLLDLWDAITTPVDLDELRKLTLQIRGGG